MRLAVGCRTPLHCTDTDSPPWISKRSWTTHQLRLWQLKSRQRPVVVSPGPKMRVREFMVTSSPSRLVVDWSVQTWMFENTLAMHEFRVAGLIKLSEYYEAEGAPAAKLRNLYQDLEASTSDKEVAKQAQIRLRELK